MSTNNLIGKLKELNNSINVSVYVPSAGKELKFKQLSVKQQKDLMKTGLDGQFSGLVISNTIKDVIFDNSLEKYNFLITDKIPILLTLRKQSFGSEFKFSDGEKDYTVSLDEVLSKKLKYKSDFSEIITDDDLDLTVEVDVPTLEYDYKFNNYTYNELKKKKDVELSETVGIAYISEIAKFIKTLKLSDDKLDLNTFSPKEVITVVENLPVTINNKILKFIEDIRKEELEYSTVNGVQIPIDARLFANQV